MTNVDERLQEIERKLDGVDAVARRLEEMLLDLFPFQGDILSVIAKAAAEERRGNLPHDEYEAAVKYHRDSLDILEGLR